MSKKVGAWPLSVYPKVLTISITEVEALSVAPSSVVSLYSSKLTPCSDTT